MTLLPLCSYPLASEAGHDDEKAGEQDEEGEDPAGLHRVGSDGRLVGGEQRGEALYAAEVEQTHDVDWQAVRLLQSHWLPSTARPLQSAATNRLGCMVNGETHESTCIAIGCRNCS